VTSPPRKKPIRTCVACRQGADKRDLVRVVRDKDGDVAVDPTGRAAGRGAYVCPELECFESAGADRLAAALRVRLSDDDIDRLRSEFEAALAERATSTAGR
jgi:predicted RNA-binding protein YlxR (DUF448 family)